jgi:hypothetical protein
MQDTFNDTDVSSIVGRATPVGGYVWTKTATSAGAGNMGIVSNGLKATGVATAMDGTFLVNTGARGRTKWVIRTAGNGQTNLILCFTSTSPLTQLWLTPTGDIRQFVSGSLSPLSATGVTWGTGDTIESLLVGSTTITLTLWKNGVQFFNGTINAAHTANTVGIYNYQDVNFVLETFEQFVQ